MYQYCSTFLQGGIMSIKYKRIILKISGEAMATEDSNIDVASVKKIALQIQQVVSMGVEVGIVVGGGNFWRGRNSKDMNRATADYIGMLATVMNSIALGDILRSVGVDNKVVSSMFMDKIAEAYYLPTVLDYLKEGKVVIFAGGCGAPFFSTDTTATLRACEIGADAVLAAKSVDGVYDSDPSVNTTAKKYEQLSYQDILSKGLKALDLTATAMASEHSIPIIVFSKDIDNSIADVVCGKKIGTIIK